MARDKYAHQRPHHGDRGHYKADGTPKVTMDQARAEGAALSLTARGRTVRAYRCPVCEGWHTGRVPERDDPLTPDPPRSAA